MRETMRKEEEKKEEDFAKKKKKKKEKNIRKHTRTFAPSSFFSSFFFSKVKLASVCFLVFCLLSCPFACSLASFYSRTNRFFSYYSFIFFSLLFLSTSSIMSSPRRRIEQDVMKLYVSLFLHTFLHTFFL